MNVLNKEGLVVKLNKHWQAFEVLTPAKAIVFLCATENGAVPGYVMDYETVVDESTGNHVLTYSVPVTWDEWIKLPVRDNDMYINTSRGKIRMPKVVITANYEDVPLCSPRLSSGNIFVRDEGVCQYTGRKLARAEGNLDHILPRDRGGKDSWDNLVWCDKKINTMKANRLNSEVGLKLIRKPQAPKTRKRLIRKSQAKIPDQTAFLID